MHWSPTPALSFRSTVSTLASLLICIQVDLCAQVEVEKGVDTEDEEQDCRDDEECILRWRERKFHDVMLLFCSIT